MQTLPTYLTRFVGRREECVELRHLLATERFVTLFGVGGVGKTRLAVEVAARLAAQYRDGVWFVELEGLRDAALITQHIAEVLEIRELEAQSSGDMLAAVIASREMLLVLDNGEHLRSAVAALVQQMLRAAPALHVLVTSRQAIGGSGEYVFRVEPLDTPSQTRSHYADLRKVDSVALFIDRARSVAPAFELDDTTERAVATLCVRLDGIPLAIELAAARMSALSIEDILDRLGDRFQLLRKVDPTAPERHQTLQALIDWSYELCEPQERTLWSRLSIFAGTIGLDAIEGVCRFEDESSVMIFEAISTLVDKGILARDQGAGRTRYKMLETIRQYGEAFLGESEVLLRERHLDWYHGLAQHVRQEWLTGSQADFINQIRQEYANIRAALEFASQSSLRADKGIGIVVSLRVFWMSSGYLGEGRHWLQRLQREGDVSEVGRGYALMHDGWFAVYEGRTSEATRLLAGASDIAARANDPGLDAYCRYTHALRQLFVGEFSEAREAFWEAYEMFGQLEDREGILLCLIQVAIVAVACDDSDTAIDLCEQAIDELENESEGWFHSYIFWAYGIAHWQRKQYDAARQLEQKSIAIKGEFGEKFGIALSLEVLSWVEASSGSHERAATMFGLLDTMFSTLGVRLAGFNHLIDHHDTAVAQVQEKLGGARFDQAFRKGQLLGFDDGVKFTLGLPAGAEARPSPVGLTPREVEVAGLVALGLSNREIASRLVLSTRTAEAHVQHILSKMGFSSRAQIASWYTASTRPTPIIGESTLKGYGCGSPQGTCHCRQGFLPQ